MNIGTRAVRALLPLALLPLAACDDPFGPQTWDATPDTAQLWSASRADLIGQPAAFDFTAPAPTPVLIETTGATQRWDVVLIDDAGQLALAPASYFLGASSRTAIAPQGTLDLDEVRRAPSDTSAYLRRPVPLRVGELYIVRSRVEVCPDGFSSGARYAKITPVQIDAAAGTVRFALVRNPYCDNRDLVPPEGD